MAVILYLLNAYCTDELLTEQITVCQAYTLYCAVGFRYAPCINIEKVTNFV